MNPLAAEVQGCKHIHLLKNKTKQTKKQNVKVYDVLTQTSVSIISVFLLDTFTCGPFFFPSLYTFFINNLF